MTKFTELERELVQLTELINQQPTQDTMMQQDSSAISTELTKLRKDRDKDRREVRELQREPHGPSDSSEGGGEGAERRDRELQERSDCSVREASGERELHKSSKSTWTHIQTTTRTM